MSEIDVIVVLGKGADEYANLLRKTGEYFKSGKHNINWLAVTTAKCRKVPKGFTKALDLEVSAYETGIVHSEGLMSGLATSTAPYTLFSDADVMILTHDWDDKLISKLTVDVAVVGFEWGGEFEKECYQNFPCITFSLFKSDIAKKLNVDLHQGTHRDPHLHTRQIKNKRLAEIFGRPTGKKFILETGWQLPYCYKRAGYQGHCLKKVCPFEKKAQIPWDEPDISKSDYPYRTRKRWVARKIGNHIMHEFYLDDRLFATHLRRSRKYLLNTKVGQMWTNNVKLYFKKKYKKNDII